MSGWHSVLLLLPLLLKLPVEKSMSICVMHVAIDEEELKGATTQRTRYWIIIILPIRDAYAYLHLLDIFSIECSHPFSEAPPKAHAREVGFCEFRKLFAATGEVGSGCLISCHSDTMFLNCKHVNDAFWTTISYMKFYCLVDMRHPFRNNKLAFHREPVDYLPTIAADGVNVGMLRNT